MSYLNHPRLTFSGQFQADVSTVNNDPRHFENDSFVARFQEFQSSASMNGWWNPIGTGIFRFSGCKVQAAIGRDGAVTDPVIGFHVGNTLDRPSGKIVDIDPDWQLASQLYGLEVSLLDPTSGRPALLAEFEAAPFRDLWFFRGGGSGDAGASAMWQSRLRNLRWSLDGVRSPLLEQLAAGAAHTGELSIRITTFKFQATASDPGFTYGTIVGAIGPVSEGEPKTFIAGRRFMPNGANSPKGTSGDAANGMSCFSAAVVGDTLVADLSNALPLDSHGKPEPLGNLHFALLRRPEIQEATVISEADYVLLGDAVDASEGSLMQQSGIQTFPIPAGILPQVTELPLALVLLDVPNPSLGMVPTSAATVMMRENADGRDVRADVFSFRLDPNAPAENRRMVPLVATRYGRPLAGAAITFQPGPPTVDISDGPTDSVPGTTPTAPIPTYNSPIGILSIEPLVATTDANGRAEVCFAGPATMGNPRRFIDGQIYAVGYNFVDAPAIIPQTFDQISVLVFSSFTAPPSPSWEDVQPILQQYANLYPIMSKGLFDFSVKAIADANAHILHFVFAKPKDDPDHMPVTRDLSEGKRRALLAYFEQVMARSTVHAVDTRARFSGRCPFSGVMPSAPPEDVPNKIIFNRLRSR